MRLKEHIDYLQEVLRVHGDIKVMIGGAPGITAKVVVSGGCDPMSEPSVVKTLEIVPIIPSPPLRRVG